MDFICAAQTTARLEWCCKQLWHVLHARQNAIEHTALADFNWLQLYECTCIKPVIYMPSAVKCLCIPSQPNACNLVQT